MDFDGEITPEEPGGDRAEGEQGGVGEPGSFRYSTRRRMSWSRWNTGARLKIEGQVRIVVIPGYDVCACCAPHVERTGEIGLIKLTGAQRIQKAAWRVTMLCGVRALADYEVKQKQAGGDLRSALCETE